MKVQRHHRNTLRVHFALAALCAALLVGCGKAPGFLHAPPDAYRVRAPAQIEGVWAHEGKDNGERVRITGGEDGSVRFVFYSVPSTQAPAEPPLSAQLMSFGGRDWLLLDRRKLSARESSEFKGGAPYTLVSYFFEGRDRLCGVEPSSRPFAAAIEQGRLGGTVDPSVKPSMKVEVTSSGAHWVDWWTSLPPADQAFTQPVFCFQRKGK
jgi:hypothetical protein